MEKYVPTCFLGFSVQMRGKKGIIGRSEVKLNTCASRLYCTTYVSIASSLRRLHAQLTFNWTIVVVQGYMPGRVIDLTMKSCHDRWWFANFYNLFVVFSYLLLLKVYCLPFYMLLTFPLGVSAELECTYRTSHPISIRAWIGDIQMQIWVY